MDDLDIKKIERRGYLKGYKAGIRKRSEEITLLKDRIQSLLPAAPERKERIFMQSLELALKHCGNWTIGGQKINTTERYCRLAKNFAQHAISEIDS